MTTPKVSEALARPVRTAGQGTAGWVGTEFIDAFIYNMNDRQYGILVVVLTILFGWIQVLIENRLGAAFMRKMPATDVPVTDEGPTTS